MLQSALVPSELWLIFVVGAVAVAVFTAAIILLVKTAKDSGYYKKVAEDNAKAAQDLKKADAIIATDVSDSDVVTKLRARKF